MFSLGVQRKIDCTGLIIGWDDPTRKATVLTCAKLLRIPEYEDRDNYYVCANKYYTLIVVISCHEIPSSSVGFLMVPFNFLSSKEPTYYNCNFDLRISINMIKPQYVAFYKS